MDVLKILGVLAILGIMYLIAKQINVYTYKKNKYEFFDQGSMIIVSFAYYFLIGGFLIYNSALQDGGDLLNGEILMGIGSLLMILNLWSNLKNTNLFISLLFTPIQLIIYAVAAAGIILVLFLAYAATASRYNYCYDD